MPCCDILKMVGFIYYQTLERGENRRRVRTGLLPECHIGHEQSVIDDEQVGTGGISPRIIVIAFAVVAALHPGTLIAFATDLFPHLVLGNESQVVTGSGISTPTPVNDRLKLGFFIVEKTLVIFVRLEFPEAEIVA